MFDKYQYFLNIFIYGAPYLRSIKSSLPFSLPLRHSCDKLFQALSRFSVLEATENWVGPGNKAK